MNNMLDKQQAREKTQYFLQQAGIVLTKNEQQQIEIASFGLNNYPHEGLQLLTYINTPRYCAKELVLWPYQTCPEHRHPPFAGTAGKQETFRCRWGEVYLFVDDENLEIAATERCRLPAGSENHYTCTRAIRLGAGEQYTIPPDTLHWFQAGEQGAVISEFSSESQDALDVFTDPRVKRQA